jgi:PncC family amidohydrolase
MPYFTDETLHQAADVVTKATVAHRSLATAESCTGGLVCAALTEIPGASQVLCGGVVSYANEVKEALLGVSLETLAVYGAVSEQTALQMAAGAREQLGADIAVSTTGVAGPQGGTLEKPVGTVWFGLADAEGQTAYLRRFEGDRTAVRSQAVAFALTLLDRSLELPR